jgi:hypothetical protein
MRRSVLFSVVLSAAVLGGCATMSSFPSTVTAFSEWNASTAKSFSFTRSAEQAQSLEHKTYEDALRKVLLEKGFTEVTADTASLRVAFSYSISEDKGRRDIYIEGPWYSGWNIGLGFHRGGSGLSFANNRWVELPWYQRELKVDISDARSGAKRYEIRATNDTQHKTLAPAIAYLAQAALSEFPLANGTSKVVRIPVIEQK